ncbi:MAG TPA: hypothetical protein VMQ76_13115 [Terracidiphilus sp.]|nr:hypothetical protein [Terracidiphilus sp.]
MEKTTINERCGETATHTSMENGKTNYWCPHHAAMLMAYGHKLEPLPNIRS